MVHGFKKPGIVRTAFDYQDLIGIELLIRFYRDPSLYQWIKLEAEDDDFGHLDDVVAARQDGSFELLQVKFTPDPERFALDWDWLLERKLKGTCLLAKWALSLEQVKATGAIHRAALRTNRRPDEAFAHTLRDGRIDIERLDDATRARVETELGGPERTVAFFAEFVFSHSEPLIDQFESALRACVVPTDTDTSGWLLLKDQVRRWASRRCEPTPDGLIMHPHLVQIITKKRPKPISQDFRVPDVYCKPSESFTDGLMERTRKHPITILWGSPGRGKSTYLSWLVAHVQDEDIPIIRHHYFLGLGDRTYDRYSIASIASSLMDQIAVRYSEAVQGLVEPSDATDHLRQWIEACALHFSQQDRRFLIVIDGLDHVWREQGDAIHLNHLFNALLPLPDNVSLIVGTQRVPDAQLPSRLLQHSEEEDWVEIPAMDESAVHRWVEGQHGAGRLILDPDRNATLQSVSKTFFEMSRGHPLHLVYSFEALVRAGAPFSEDAIRNLPPCPDGDIRTYYRSLWARLTPQARQVLHVIAGSPFPWPSTGLRRCIGPTDEIDHLMERKRSGIVPFHGSLLAYARELPDHTATFDALLPNIVKWLENDAEEFWAWGWLWIMRAKAGDARDLKSKPTREWARTSLLSGWPREQIIAVLEHAEQATFKAADYARTMELRSLKIRLLNAPESQMSKFDKFEETAIRLHGNVQHVLSLADSIQTLPDRRILTLARAAPAHASDIRTECVDELRRRINLWINLRHKPIEEFHALTRRFLDVLSVAPQFDVPSVLNFLAGFGDPKEMVEWALEYLTRERRFEELMVIDTQIANWSKLAPSRPRVQDALTRTAALEGIDLVARLRAGTPVSPLLACWGDYHGAPHWPLARSPTSEETITSASIENALHDVFFRTLAQNLAGEEPAPFEGYLPSGDANWLRQAFANLQSTAALIACGHAQLSFATPYFYASGLAPDQLNEPTRSHYSAFKSALRRIAIDVHCIKSPTGRRPNLHDEELAAARRSPHWVEELWISDQLEQRLTLCHEPDERAAVYAAAAAEGGRISVFNERADTWTDLARLAELYRLESAHALLRRAADCILGHGWRKDLWLDDVLEAIEDVHQRGAADGTELLTPLVPIIEPITEFTDGDETDHVRSQLIRTVAKVCPDRLPRFYEHHLETSEFRYADETLIAHLEQVDLNTPESKALAQTLMEPRHLNVLARRAECGDALSRDLAAQQIAFLGGEPLSREHEYKDTSSTADKPPPDFTAYGPHQFDALMEAASSYRIDYKERSQCLRNWLDHWKGRGKGTEAITAISGFMRDRGSLTQIDDILDQIFEVSLALQGREAAYPWLVKAHIHRHGWSYYAGDAEAMHRLDRAASCYGDRWERYIRDSSRPSEFSERRGRTAFSFGARYMVRFLLLVGERDRAVALVKACVAIAVAEVEDQPIPPCPWFH